MSIKSTVGRAKKNIILKSFLASKKIVPFTIIHYHSPFILKEVIKLKYTIAAKTFVTLLIILFVFLSYVLIKVVM